MAERSRYTTRALRADQTFCRQVARLQFTDTEPIRRAFLGEPVKEVLALVEWAMEHEDEPGFETGQALEAWARRRCRGAYRRQERGGGNRTARLDISAPRRSDEVSFGYGVSQEAVLTSLDWMVN